jgi:hypothetical protein
VLAVEPAVVLALVGWVGVGVEVETVVSGLSVVVANATVVKSASKYDAYILKFAASDFPAELILLGTPLAPGVVDAGAGAVVSGVGVGVSGTITGNTAGAVTSPLVEGDGGVVLFPEFAGTV